MSQPGPAAGALLARQVMAAIVVVLYATALWWLVEVRSAPPPVDEIVGGR